LGLAREAGPGSCPGASAAAGGEMSAELVSSALGLALYLNTLGADFCYDDRYGGRGAAHLPATGPGWGNGEPGAPVPAAGTLTGP